MKAASVPVIPFPGIKEIKQVEPYSKWRKFLPEEFRDVTCPKPDEDLMERQKGARMARKRKAEDAKRAALNLPPIKRQPKKKKKEPTVTDPTQAGGSNSGGGSNTSSTGGC
jgi:hypothetical protein